MRKLAALSLMLLATPLAASAQEWAAITLYPPQSVYSADTLSRLVISMQHLMDPALAGGVAPLAGVDGLASMNAVVAQDGELRFRRLIEARELDADGLKRMRALIDSHPLLRQRLVSPDGRSTHLWLRFQPALTAEAVRAASGHYAARVAADFGASCRVRSGHADDALHGIWFQQWLFQAAAPVPATVALAALRDSGHELARHSEQHWSALELFEQLLTAVATPAPATDDGWLQLYAIAESLRNRDLRNLASPDWSRLTLAALGHGERPTPTLTGYRLHSQDGWSDQQQPLLVVDCTHFLGG